MCAMAGGTQRSVVAALLLVVVLLFLVRRLSTPARTIVFLRTKPEALPSSDPADHSRTVRSRPLSSLPLQSALPPLPSQLRPPPPPPPPPPCTALECTTKLQSLEPDWVQLSSQPRIDCAVLPLQNSFVEVPPTGGRHLNEGGAQ